MSNVVYSINCDKKWDSLLSSIKEIRLYPDKVNKIVVVAMGTAILSAIKLTCPEQKRADFKHLIASNIDFYICVNTMNRYNITKELLIPEFKIAERGASIKILEFEEIGYKLFIEV